MSLSVETFNEAKYKALMDGLECSEILLSKLGDNSRIDAEYYKKIHLKTNKLLNAAKSISEIANTVELHTNGAFAKVYQILHDNEVEEVPYIRSENVGNYFICGNLEKISRKAHKQLKYTQTRINDILVARTGKIGGASIITDRWIDCNSNQNVVNIRIFDNEYSPILTTLFLNTRYGIAQFERASTGNVQPWLNLSSLRKVKVPQFTNDFIELIEYQFNLALVCIEKADALYRCASDKLSFNKIYISNLNNTVKLFSDSYKSTGRLDAEYYQPKYDELFAFLKKQSTKPLGGNDGIVTIRKSIEPGSDSYCDEGISFVRVSDVTKYGISEPSIKLPFNIVAEPNKLYLKENTILFSKDGSVGIAYKVEKDTEVITSGALLHLTVKNPLEVLPDYLTLILNSPIVQLQAERDSSGAIIQHWKPSEIEKVVIPVLDIEVQKQISKKVQESFALRHQSEELLEYAKRAVEIAIEQSEEIAMKWLKEKGVEC